MTTPIMFTDTRVWQRLEQAVCDLAGGIASKDLDQWFEQRKLELNDVRGSIERQREMTEG